MDFDELHISENRIDTNQHELLGIMADAVNRHSGEYNVPGIVDKIAGEIYDEAIRRRILPVICTECDILSAARCFVATVLRKQLDGYSGFDRYITDESSEKLRVLTNFCPCEIFAFK